MRTKRIVAAAVAAGVVGAGAVATPLVFAADNDDTGDDTTMPYGQRWNEDDDVRGPMGNRGQMRQQWQEDGPQGRGMGHGMMWGGGGQGMGPGGGQGMGPGGGQGLGPGGGQHMRGEGDCLLDEDGVAEGTLTEAQEAALLEQVEHEKVARDVYAAYFKSTGDYRFERIAGSEQHHLDALRMLVDRYDLTDPTKGMDEGEFKSDAFQEEYDAYLQQGDDRESALEAAQAIEKDDIADLTEAAEGLDAPDVKRVYEQQIVASEHHLAAFSR